MQIQKQYEILEGLPPYGPMYIPISESGKAFYNEGFVVRFFKKDGSNWVANFKTGWTDFNDVFELSGTNKIVVIANGQGYIMTTEDEKPIATFGLGITQLIKANDNRYIAAEQTDLVVIEHDGSIWRTERISWDGIKDLILENNIVNGLSFDPMNEADEWVKFSVNLDTKEVTGGSYNRYEFKEVKKPFWKFW